MITTTLNRIRERGPCKKGWEKLLRHLGKTCADDDEPLPFSVILDSNGLDDALWCCRVEPQHSTEWRLFAVWCARQVERLMTDPRSRAALGVAERHALGEASDEELAQARKDAYAAYAAAYAAAAYAAHAAHAAYAAAYAAHAAHAAAAHAATAAADADAAAAHAAYDVARKDMRKRQAAEFRRSVS